MKSEIQQILFSLTNKCNLNCLHCNAEKGNNNLSKKLAIKFLTDCYKNKIKKVGFTGGEPFLHPNLLYALIKKATQLNMSFDRIMTNGVWFKNGRHLETIFEKIRKAGYTGNICLSIDFFHKQNINKISKFIKTAVNIWGTSDIISIACTTGKKDKETKNKLLKLSNILNARLFGYSTPMPYIKNKDLFINIFKINLSPVGKARILKNPWDNKWFKEDYCKGPGNVFFITPEGDVKPCCGYATECNELTIGNIKYNSVKDILKNIRKNRFVYTVFNTGLSSIRKQLEKNRVKFPGKTSNHCYFCYYILTQIPKKILNQCLNN